MSCGTCGGYYHCHCDVNKMKEDHNGPMLIFDQHTGEVTGHEGRHRMVLLQNDLHEPF